MRIKILRNTRKEWTSRIERDAISFLKSNNLEIVTKNADITLCIGGDGTIFYFNHMEEIEGSVLAIGSDSSYICQLHCDDWKAKILSYIKRNEKESRITLVATVGKKKFSALNDVVLHTVDYRIISTNVRIDSSRKSFEGDGIIIATPTGSTAYSYSAGGLIIDEAVEAIEVVPICPYKRLVSPEIVHENSEIEVSSDRISDLVIDGIFIKKLKPKEKVSIKKGEKILFLV